MGFGWASANWAAGLPICVSCVRMRANGLPSLDHGAFSTIQAWYTSSAESASPSCQARQARRPGVVAVGRTHSASSMSSGGKAKRGKAETAADSFGRQKRTRGGRRDLANVVIVLLPVSSVGQKGPDLVGGETGGDNFVGDVVVGGAREELGGPEDGRGGGGGHGGVGSND